MHRVALIIIFALAGSSLTASAQDTPSLSLRPPTPAADLGTHPDTGLMVTGAVLFLTPMVIAVAALLPYELGHCVDPEDTARLPGDHGFPPCDRAALVAVPFAHLLGGSTSALIAGPILLIHEVIGLFMFIGGAAHHHPNAPQPGDVSVAGVPGADLGLALALHL